MKTHIFLSALGLVCLLSLVDAQCDLSGQLQDVSFPNISAVSGKSYIMGVDYSIPGVEQTDYYMEYYDVLNQRGRLESHAAGKSKIFIYRSETIEAWTIEDKKCTFQILYNSSDIPLDIKEYQTDWQHPQDPESPTTVGPSAMLKNALDAWNVVKDRKMAYMGVSNSTVRGEKAVFWRRCLRDGSSIDYYFATAEARNPFDIDKLNKVTPLRIVFKGSLKNDEISEQVYDIVSFQQFIPAGVEPFELPKGLNCRRSEEVNSTVLPDFSKNSLLFSAEVVYETIKDGSVESSYYSILKLALDRQSNHLAYYYSPWNTTMPDPETKLPFEDTPRYVIYDTRHQYTYKIDYGTAKCTVSRVKSFVPEYKLPNGLKLALTNPYVLFPHNLLRYLTKGTNRGLTVDIFEAEQKNFLLSADAVIDRAIITHSYLTYNEELENKIGVRNAPTQMQFRFFRIPEVEERLTLNIFGFTTRIPNRRYLFNVERCFKNDDDYLFVTIGFEIANQYLSEIESALPEIEQNVVEKIFRESEINPMRMPTVMTDLKDNYVYVTMTILGKPTLQLDFPGKVGGKKIVTSDIRGSQGASNFDTCANNCLEDRDDCWGFSLCGATCYYGNKDNYNKTEEDKSCTLYYKLANVTFMPSKESQAKSIVEMVDLKEFMVVAILPDKGAVTLTATTVEIRNPAGDESLFENMGNYLNPRMRVFKTAKKLKSGSVFKNLGKLRYDECQSLCLDFKECETVSYCLKNYECMISNKFDSDLTDKDDIDDNNLCVLLARKYTDNFDRTPGVFVETTTGTKKNIGNVEDCARACLNEGDKCLSFDHCAGEKDKGCSLYTVQYLSAEDRKKSVTGKSPRCGHYTRKFSTDFRRKDENRILGSKVPSLTNLTLEQCAKSCMEYGQGTCFGYNFCQDRTLFSTQCTLIDSDPSRLKSSYSPICTSYQRLGPEYAAHPYTNSYAGGIGFLCFLVGGFIGAVVVFAISYYRANRAN